MPIQPMRDELIADMKAVQALCWTCRITRNYYRVHGKFKEHEWHYYFPTFKDFLVAASIVDTQHEEYTNEWANYLSVSDLVVQTDINPILNLANSKAGDFFAMGGKLYQVTDRNDGAVYTRRYRWFNRLHDWLRG